MVSSRNVTVEYEGAVSQLNYKPLTAAALAGLMAPMITGANMVNAPVLARERGIEVTETVHDRASEYQTLIRVTVATDGVRRSVAGTLFSPDRNRGLSKSRASRSRPSSAATCST